jgi:predicted GNAT family acetyltransferase
MSLRAYACVLLAATLLPGAALAAESLPEIKTSPSNVVPECVTPGRLMAFLEDRNPRLRPEHKKIAVDYMRHGEQLGLRWDYAFFQMVVETGYLTFERSKGRFGDVKPNQNNFAGLGATGRGVPGESFPNVSTGVLAHLQHVLMYSGEKIDAPVAERTQKVIEWRVLDDWRASIKGPMTFAQLAQKWANNKTYADGIATHAEIFATHFCNTADPAPELLAEARPGRPESKPAVAAVSQPETPREIARETDTARAPESGRGSGRELAQRAIDDARARGDNRRSSLGGTGLGTLATEQDMAAATLAPGASEPNSPLSPLIQAASTVGSMLKSMTQPTPPPAVAPPAPPPAQQAKLKCRVWTASYGGSKAILIKASTGEGVSYTVLDVNEGAEKREAAAYIAAYAKGGEVESSFSSQTQALEKAFELCPEG